MLDLNKLARKLEEALELETIESLTSWLMNKRGVSSINYLGEGDYLYDTELGIFTEQITSPVNHVCSKNTLVSYPCLDSTQSVNMEANTQYAIAA